MTDIAPQITVSEVASIVEQAAAAVVATIENPSPATILADLETALSLVSQFKANLNGLHPSITNIIKALF